MKTEISIKHLIVYSGKISNFPSQAVSKYILFYNWTIYPIAELIYVLNIGICPVILNMPVPLSNVEMSRVLRQFLIYLLLDHKMDF